MRLVSLFDLILTPTFHSKSVRPLLVYSPNTLNCCYIYKHTFFAKRIAASIWKVSSWCPYRVVYLNICFYMGTAKHQMIVFAVTPLYGYRNKPYAIECWWVVWLDNKCTVMNSSHPAEGRLEIQDWLKANPKSLSVCVMSYRLGLMMFIFVKSYGLYIHERIGVIALFLRLPKISVHQYRIARWTQRPIRSRFDDPLRIWWRCRRRYLYMEKICNRFGDYDENGIKNLTQK